MILVVYIGNKLHNVCHKIFNIETVKISYLYSIQFTLYMQSLILKINFILPPYVSINIQMFMSRIYSKDSFDQVKKEML